MFRVLVVDKGFEPTFFSKVDPKSGPLEARLKHRAAPTMPASQIILGRVIDPNKKPLANAVVSVGSTTIGNTTYGSPPEGTDPLAVTDEQGEFEIRCPKKFDAMELRVEALRFARRNFAETRPGPRRQDFVVTLGAALAGRVLQNGKPVKNITVGVASVDRSMGHFTGDFVTGTGDDGRFVFPNLPPDREYAVYGLMDSMNGIGALPAKTLRLKGDGSKTDMADWQVVPGLRLEGQVLLSNSNAIPQHTHLNIGRELAWDSSAIELPPDGRFSFSHVPSEVLNVSTRIKSYSFSAKNASLDRLNPFRLLGRLESDKTNLVILLEPGENLKSDHSPGDDRPENFPLCGIEAKRVTPDAVLINGRVLDATDNTPVAQFRITPGIQMDARFSRPQWQQARSAAGTNGAFCLEISAKRGLVVLQAEAEGYLPLQSEPLASGQSNCVLRLKRGNGPTGIVQLPDGTPLANTKVTYLSGDEQASVDQQGELTAFAEGATKATDAAGKFSFAPKVGAGELVVACSSGFGRLPLASPEGTNVVTVQPWAEVRGRLVKDGKPVQNEHVDVSLDSEWKPGQPHLNFGGAITDEDGRFSIGYVPPGAIQLTTRKPMGQRAWTNERIKRFDARPGEKVDVGDVENARRPNLQ